MRVAQRERGDLSLDVGAIPDADDVQLADESGADALHRVGGQRPRQSVQRRMLVAGALDFQLARALLERDAGRDRHGKRALRSADFQMIADRYLDARGQRYRLFTNSRHSNLVALLGAL